MANLDHGPDASPHGSPSESDHEPGLPEKSSNPVHRTPILMEEPMLAEQALGLDDLDNALEMEAKGTAGKDDASSPVGAGAERGPLRLLDLPTDILREIVKQVTYTNDLTSLALTHSALHNLVIPLIYSRFDIVWPDAHSTEEPGNGVDALTFGLATLVMAEEVLSYNGHVARAEPSSSVCQTCGNALPGQDPAVNADPGLPRNRMQRRRGNHYAQFTRKFSLGNGPADMVAEYLISRERGKMLGTLVALAVARMPNLETFTWDMPSGVLRDVWLALASLGGQRESGSSRLKQVWVRWHNNSLVNPVDHHGNSTNAATSSMHATSPGHVPGPGLASGTQPQSINTPLVNPARNVESPTFSVLPPLESLTVLEIDELAYLDEVSVLVGKSQHRLRELRIGIAAHAAGRRWEWTKSWEGTDVIQVDPQATWLSTHNRAGTRRLGGVLGVILGRVHDLRKRESRARSLLGAAPPEAEKTTTAASVPSEDGPGVGGNVPLPSSALDQQDNGPKGDDVALKDAHHPNQKAAAPSQESEKGCRPLPDSETSAALDGKLRLELLELERVDLCIPALQRAFDWTTMTSLTLLNCDRTTQFWKMMRRTFAPPSVAQPSNKGGHSAAATPKSAVKGSTHAGATASADGLECPLRLKKIHTDDVTHALLMFLSDTLPPNSLEVLLLQTGGERQPSVPVESIYLGPLRRHRKSLQKLLIDSSQRYSSGDLIVNSRHWKRWMLTRDILSGLMSGKFPALKELGMAIDHKDWHFFLQRLPQVSHLRSLYITHMLDFLASETKELALQVLDIITLRPEVELCYLALFKKCYEIVEEKTREERRRPAALLPGQTQQNGAANSNNDNNNNDADASGSEEDENDEDDDDDVNEDVTVDEDGEGDDEGTESAGAPDESDADALADFAAADSDDELGPHAVHLKPPVTLRLREILFYDERVAIFKARHGRL